MNNVIHKMFQTKATSIDEVNFNITFKVSDSSVDRQGEIVSQKDWKMANYMANPVLLFGHDPSKPQFVLGKCLSMEYDAAQDCHYGTYHLDADFNPDALLVWNQLVAGTLRTVSLGFIHHSKEYEDGTPVLAEIEPLETSIVPIPANAGALAKAFKDGSISKKDAKWLTETMRAEIAFVEKQMAVEPPKPKEKTMNDEQASALLDGITKLSGTVETLTMSQADTNTRLDSLATDLKTAAAVKTKGAVADIINADRGWDVDDEKWDRSKAVNEIVYALFEAYYYSATPVDGFNPLLEEAIQLLQTVLDGTYGDGEGIVAKGAQSVDSARVKDFILAMGRKEAPPAEPTEEEAEAAKEAEEDKQDAERKAADEESARKTEEDSKAKDDDKDPADLAKGGSDDQPGATDGEIDDDTELTPEQEAELAAEVQAQYAASKA